MILHIFFGHDATHAVEVGDSADGNKHSRGGVPAPLLQRASIKKCNDSLRL